MRKYTIIGVIILMSISLLGVVGLQLYWINNAIKVKQQLFERNVHDALASVVNKLETREAISVVTGQMAAAQQSVTLPLEEIIDSSDFPTSKGKVQITIKNTPSRPQTKKEASDPVAKEKETTSPEKIRLMAQTDVVYTSPTQLNNPARTQHLQMMRIDTVLGKTDWTSLPRNKTTFIVRDSIKGNSIKGISELTQFTPALLDTAVAMYKRLPKGTPFRMEKRFEDAKRTDLSNRDFFRVSADTLQYVAITLGDLKLDNISYVEAKNDSVYIYKRGVAKPIHVYKPAKLDTKSGFNLKNGTFTDNAPLHLKSLKPTHIRITEVQGKAKIQEKPEDSIATNAKLKQEAKQKIAVKKEKLNDVVQKMMEEYVVREVPLKERLNIQNLQALLTEELNEKGIDLDYGYHVVASNKDTVAVKEAASFTGNKDNLHYYATFLFPNDIIDKPDYLAVYFPDTESYAFKSLTGMMSLSGLFTLIIIATFATTIHIIYKQKRLSEMKNDFINNMTHEFKTPIATISLATDSIFNPKVHGNPEKIKYYTSIIKEENKRMNAQVENVLQIALLEKNEFKLNLQPVDVHVLILKAIESIKLQVEQRLGHIAIKLDAPEHELHSDEIHLFNVICNLLDNANKYSPGKPEIELTTQNIAGGLLIAVDDKGMGMSKETQQRVFEKFYRVPTGNLHNVKGFGLGLSYVKAIVQAHRGNIKLWSEPGRGSRFEIFLPFKH